MRTSVTAPDASTPMVALDLITSRGNLRRVTGDTSELEASITAVGLIEPLVVCRNGKGFDLLAGHRRLEAVRRLKWEEAPVHVVDTSASDADVARLAIQLVENLQRNDLDAVDEASGYAQLKAYGWTQAQIAKRVGRSEALISKRLALLELPGRAFDLHDAGRVGSESLYELTKVIAAGGDLDPILDQLAETSVEDTTRPVEEVEQLVRIAVRGASASSELAARVAELETADVRVLPAKYDPHGRATLPKDRLDWGFDLDVDKHAKEPCHAVCVYIQHDAVRESFHCTYRRRHGPDGASKLKLKGKAGRSTVEKTKETAHKALLSSMVEAAEGIMEGRAPARDTVVQMMAALYVRGLSADARKRAVSLLDLTAELSDEGYTAFERLYEEADATSRHRILLAAVIADGYTRSSGYSLTDDARAGHVAFLADLGHPVDHVEIHPGGGE